MQVAWYAQQGSRALDTVDYSGWRWAGFRAILADRKRAGASLKFRSRREPSLQIPEDLVRLFLPSMRRGNGS